MACAHDNGRYELEIRVPCKPEFVRTIRRAIVDFAETFETPVSTLQEMEVATAEAVTNVIRHAYPNSASCAPLQVKCRRGRQGFTLEVIDKGNGFAPPENGFVPERDLDAERDGGFGIVLIKNLMDQVDYTSGPHRGTRLKMTKRARRALSRVTRPTLPTSADAM